MQRPAHAFAPRRVCRGAAGPTSHARRGCRRACEGQPHTRITPPLPAGGERAPLCRADAAAPSRRATTADSEWGPLTCVWAVSRSRRRVSEAQPSHKPQARRFDFTGRRERMFVYAHGIRSGTASPCCHCTTRRLKSCPVTPVTASAANERPAASAGVGHPAFGARFAHAFGAWFAHGPEGAEGPDLICFTDFLPVDGPRVRAGLGGSR